MEEYGRLAYLTRHYYDLQGLRLAPLWVAGLFIGPVRSQFGFAGKAAVIIVILAIFLLWFWLAGRYYRLHFGCLKPDLPVFARRTPVRWFHWLFVIALFAAAVVPGIVSSRPVNPSMWLPFYLAFLTSIFLFDPEAPLTRTAYYGAGTALLVVDGLLRLFSGYSPLILFALVSATMLALAITDHILLLHLFGAAGDEANV